MFTLGSIYSIKACGAIETNSIKIEHNIVKTSCLFVNVAKGLNPGSGQSKTQTRDL